MIYNVILNTANRTNLFTDSVINSEFFFDWSVLPEGKYEMTFSFISSNVNLSTIENVALISAYLGQGCNFVSNPLRTSAITTNIIGVLTPYLVSSKSYLYADKLINHPMTINNHLITILLLAFRIILGLLGLTIRPLLQHRMY